jgi:uncharacterized protein
MSSRVLQALCQGTLETLVTQTPGVDTAAVVTGDGFEVASVLREHVSVEKLAAMVSSLLALSEAVTSEMGMQRCQYVIVDTESGALLTLRVPTRSQDLLMCALCGDGVSLGSVLYAVRESARALARRLLPE